MASNSPLIAFEFWIAAAARSQSSGDSMIACKLLGIE
jgi:hypothetical protein